MTVKLGVELDDQTARAFKVLCAQEGRSMSELMRVWIVKALERESSRTEQKGTNQ